MWQGALDEALQLARRSLALQAMPRRGPARVPDRLLLARVLAARGEHAELARSLATFVGEDSRRADEQIVVILVGAIARG